MGRLKISVTCRWSPYAIFTYFSLQILNPAFFRPTMYYGIGSLCWWWPLSSVCGIYYVGEEKYRRMEKRAVTNIARARTTNENYWKTITSVTKTFLIFLHTVIRINKAVIIASQVLPEKDGRVLLLHFLCVLSLLEWYRCSTTYQCLSVTSDTWQWCCDYDRPVMVLTWLLSHITNTPNTVLILFIVTIITFWPFSIIQPS